MLGIPDRDYAALRFLAFADELLAAGLFRRRVRLDVSIHQTEQRVALDQARRGVFGPVAPGLRWGPAWSTAWFRIRGVRPEPASGATWALRFQSGTEALLWWRGAPCQGFDANRELCRLPPDLEPGEAFECYVEAACNMPLGISTFWWDDPELVRRWQEERPGRFEYCELVAVDGSVRDFHLKCELARRLALALPENSARSLELLCGLREIVNQFPFADSIAGIEAAGPELDRLLRGRQAQATARTRCFAVGHAHLDTAWLWPIAETRRKILRSWSNALELMDRFPDFRFLASQAQQYAFCEQDAPLLFERIRARVVEGRWEAGGAMWVESDAHAPSGEALIRQIVHGVAYFRDQFGEHGRQTSLFLPDTFGFPASLPQILRLAGLTTFITDKLAWSERHEFPHVSFAWRGIDGTEVLTHLTPGSNYNAPLQPDDLLRGEQRLLEKDHSPVSPRRAFLDGWLQPFGYGDGGGGPTEEIVRRAELSARVEGLPRVEPSRVDQFCESLHEARRRAHEQQGSTLPVFDGELYLEQHRGTFTSQAWQKQANARAERHLRVAEALLSQAPEGPSSKQRELLDRLWKVVLLHQFHDILPGTSIRAVYDDARVAYQALEQDLEALLRGAALQAAGSAVAGSYLVFNPTSQVCSAVVDVGEQPVFLAALPALGGRVVHPSRLPAAKPPEAVRVSERSLENDRIAVRLDSAGRVARLSRLGAATPVNAVREDGELEPLNQLVLYADRPRRWEAWNLDFDYPEKATPLDGPADTIRVIENGPLRGVIEVRRAFSSSLIIQRYVLTAGSLRLEIETEIDWQERRTLLRTLQRVNVRARSFVSGIQFGHLERPAHRNTAYEQAGFEVPGHRWMDLSQPGLGLAVLDDGKLGRSCSGNELGLSLLRAPDFPDPDADRGRHVFRYALYPHAGDFRQAHVARQADELAEPPLLIPLSGLGALNRGSEDLAPFELELDDDRDVEVACLKPAEDGVGLILRLVERHGGRTEAVLRWKLPVSSVQPVDLLELPVERELTHAADDRVTRFSLRPFEILTLRVGLGRTRRPGT